MTIEKLFEARDLEASSNSWLIPLFQFLSLAFLLYLFVLPIALLGDSFKLMSKGLAQSIFEVTSHPIVGLFIGIFATSVIQSSSTTSSIVVGWVGAATLSFENAVPIIMGANVGTSVTNTIVSLAHVSFAATNSNGLLPEPLSMTFSISAA